MKTFIALSWTILIALTGNFFYSKKVWEPSSFSQLWRRTQKNAESIQKGYIKRIFLTKKCFSCKTWSTKTWEIWLAFEGFGSASKRWEGCDFGQIWIYGKTIRYNTYIAVLLRDCAPAPYVSPKSYDYFNLGKPHYFSII